MRSTACLARWSLRRPKGDPRLFVLRPSLKTLELGRSRFELGRRTLVMGVVNVTPDSFSDGGRFVEAAAAIAHGEQLVALGADVLDVGGESTRPGAPEVSADEELRRVVQVIEGLHRRLPQTPISIDTSKAVVAEAAIEAGAVMVNDVTALRHDARLPEVVARSRVALCLMHMQGTPRTMQQNPQYRDVVGEVVAFLSDAAQRALAAGVKAHRIVVDPGIGFGKTLEHNLKLLKHLGALRELGYPVLLGTSRKAFLGTLTGGKPATDRAVATAASVAAACSAGAVDIVRVHDVAEALDAVRVADAIFHADGV